MSPFEFMLLFASVILGLALTDLALSLHRLIAAGPRVRWDWLSPLAALVAFLKIVTQAWTWYEAGRLANGLTFEMFLAVLIGSVLLFMLTATALPDEFGEQHVDLRDYYASISRRYWLLFALQWSVMNGVSIWAQIAIGHATFSPFAPAFLLLPLALLLALWQNRFVHTLALLALTALYLQQYAGNTLMAAH